MVVEEDIDIRNREALDWALGFRVNASEGQLQTFGGTFGSVLDPSVAHNTIDVPRYGTGSWTRVLIDATRNWNIEPNPDWDGRRMAPINVIPPETEQKIRDRWSEYGIGVPYLDDDQREMLTLEQMRKILPDV